MTINNDINYSNDIAINRLNLSGEKLNVILPKKKKRFGPLTVGIIFKMSSEQQTVPSSVDNTPR